MQPKVGVVVLSYKFARDTIECITSVKESAYPDFDIIVVDNHSPDNAAAQIRETHPDIHIIENSANLGFCEGNNIGIAEALKKGAEYVLVLNNDTVVDKDFLAPLVEMLQNNPVLGMTSPLIFYYEKRDVLWSAGGNLNMWRPANNCMGKTAGQCIIPARPDYLPGCCLLIKAEALKKAGLFDPWFFLFSEDVDLSLRVRKAGYELGVSDRSKIYHKVSLTTSGEDSPVSRYYGTRNRFLLMKKHGGIVGRLQFYLAVLPLVVIKNLVKHSGDAKVLAAFLEGLKDGLAGRFGKNPKLTP